MKVAKLIMITPSNNNKFYNMYANDDDDTFRVEYGRVGATAQIRTYPISKWDSTYRSKTKKGYIDNTELFVTENSANYKNKDKFLKTRSKEIIDVVNQLQNWANASVSENYTVSSENVTQKQVDKAQELLNEIAQFDLNSNNINEFNDMLLKFYSIVPRKMKNVNDFLLNINDSDLDKSRNDLISNEQDTLDVMTGQVKLNKAVPTDADNIDIDTDIISDAGLELEYVTDDTIINIIKDLMGQDANKFKNAYAVVNKNTQSKFDKHLKDSKNKKTELFWHGSRNENWWSIITNGLLIRPASAKYTGSMFGDGIYFADKFRKSFGYTSGRRSYWAKGNSNVAVLALYEVHVGNQKIMTRHDSNCYGLSYKIINSDGFDSVYAKPGASIMNAEYVVYQSQQSTIRYLVTVNA
jgi:poly [ADP-ribose] polymerase